MPDHPISQPFSDQSVFDRDPCDGCDGTCGDVCPVMQAQRLAYERIRPDAQRYANTPAGDMAREIDRLRGLVLDTQARVRELDESDVRLRAEAERRREALDEIVDDLSVPNPPPWAAHALQVAQMALQIDEIKHGGSR